MFLLIIMFLLCFIFSNPFKSIQMILFWKKPILWSLSGIKTTHCWKKYAVNACGNNCSFQEITFRAGWILKSLHAIFDYLFANRKKDQICAKYISNWGMKIFDKIVGGIPPSIHNIVDHKEQATLTQDLLFGHVQGVEREVLDLIFAALLRW